MATIGTYPARAGGDSDPIPVSSSPLVAPLFTSGQQVAPVAAIVVTDTGALGAGVYRVEANLGFSGVLAAGKHLTLEHRNAANAANVTQLGMCPAGGSESFVFERVVLAAGERIRAIVGAVAAAAGEVAHGTIRVYLLPL